MKKVTKYLFILLYCCLIFSACQMQPPMCKVSLEFNYDKGIASVDNDYVPLGSFVTVTVEPKIGYDCYRLESFAYNFKYFKTDNEYVYKVFVNDSKVNIEVNFESLSQNSVSADLINCTVTNDLPAYAYKNQLIELKLAPSNYYRITKDCINITAGYDKIQIPFNMDETEENKIYFKMPNQDIQLSVKAYPVIEIIPDKEKYLKGDMISFNVNNYSSVQKCNLYYSYSSEDYKELYKTDFNISDGLFTITPIECGQIDILAELSDGTVLNLDTVIVEPEKFSQDNKIISCHLLETDQTEDYSHQYCEYVFVTTNVLNLGSRYFNIKFYDKEKKFIESSRATLNETLKISSSLEYSYDEPEEIYVQLSCNNYLSDYIPVILPCYEKIKESKSSTYYVYTDSGDVLVPGEGFEDLFTVEIDSSSQIKITSKTDAKPTKIPRSFTVTDSEGTEKEVYKVTLDYDGWPSLIRQ